MILIILKLGISLLICCKEANDMVLLFTQNLEVPKLFHANSQINHTASDGQKFNLSV